MLDYIVVVVVIIIMAEFSAEQFAALLKHAVAITARNPDGHLTTEDFTAHQRIKLFFNRTCSLNEMQRTPDLQRWRVDPGAEHIFQRIAGLHPETREPKREGDLSKGMILNMRLVRVDSNFPVDLGVNITDVHGIVGDGKGNTYAFIAPKNKSREPANEVIYVPKNVITRDLLARFNDINPKKLREGTIMTEESPMAGVDNKCIIAEMIRFNHVSLGIDINEVPRKGEDGWFVLDKRVVQACMAAYEEEQKVGFHDMRNFELTFTRVDSPKNFAAPEGT